MYKVLGLIPCIANEQRNKHISRIHFTSISGLVQRKQSGEKQTWAGEVVQWYSLCLGGIPQGGDVVVVQ